MGKHQTSVTKHQRKPAKHHSRVKEIVFDPEARRDYLRGFSERKRQRRAFGLAHQKVKDRNAKLEARRETSKAMLEQVEEAEKQKEEFMEELWKQNQNNANNGSRNNGQQPNSGEYDAEVQEGETRREEKSGAPESATTTTTAYRDGVTQDQWGGHVIVTTSTEIPDDDDDDDGADNQQTHQDSGNAQPSHHKRKDRSVDEAQEYAGKVDRFLEELKGNMPKKKKDHRHSHKGRHGAAGMKGMASTATGDFQIAQKALARSKQANNKKKKKRSGRK